MEDERGIGGRKAIEIQWIDLIHDDQEYTVGIITK